MDEFSASGRGGLVDVAEFLVPLPGQGDFVVRSPRVSLASSRAACLSVRCSANDLQGPAGAEERIALATAVLEGVLLDAAADLIDHG